jgi:hypothetical protein
MITDLPSFEVLVSFTCPAQRMYTPCGGWLSTIRVAFSGYVAGWLHRSNSLRSPAEKAQE